MDELGQVQADGENREKAGKIDSLGWGVLFIWIGIAFLADLGWSIGVLGVGVIALAVQAARVYCGLPIEFFGLGMGIAMVAWGTWHLFGLAPGELDLPGGVVPFLFIALGAVLVLKAIARKPSG